MEGFVVVCGVILVAATLCTIYRLAKGPTCLLYTSPSPRD